jgi:hypothetical protein
MEVTVSLPSLTLILETGYIQSVTRYHRLKIAKIKQKTRSNDQNLSQDSISYLHIREEISSGKIKLNSQAELISGIFFLP